MSDYDLIMLVARINNLYQCHGLCGPTRLREVAKGWLGIPIEDIIAAVELHFLHCRHRYAAGSGDGWFHVVQRAVDALRDKRLHAEDARPRPPAKRGVSHSPSRTQRPTVTKLHRGAGYVEAFVDDEGDLPLYARPGAAQPQPFHSRQGRSVQSQGVDGDDDPADV